MVTATKTRVSCDWLLEALVELGPGERVFATGIPWAVYVRLTDLRDERRPGVKITFDRGRIELTSPKIRHEQPHFRLGIVVLMLAKQLGIEIRNAGALTLRSEAKEQGLEADESFYVANASSVLNAPDIDLLIHPPPDLAIEIDLTSSSVSKEAIYSTIGVPEIWRQDDDEVVIRHLQLDRTYQTAERSLAFPQVRATDLTQLLVEANEMGEVAFFDHCIDWVKTLVPPAANP
jgi:Uma2 family endonuclease